MTKDPRHRLPWLPEAFLARASWKHARGLLPRVVVGKIEVKEELILHMSPLLLFTYEVSDCSLLVFLKILGKYFSSSS